MLFHLAKVPLKVFSILFKVQWLNCVQIYQVSRIFAITRGVIAASEESSLLIDLFEITFRRFFVSNQRVIISVKACSNLFL